MNILDQIRALRAYVFCLYRDMEAKLPGNPHIKDGINAVLNEILTLEQNYQKLIGSGE